MNFSLKNFALILFVGLSSTLIAQNNRKVDTNIFPKAEKNQKQVVIELPHSANDHNKKVEIFVGKDMETDQCNRYTLPGKFTQHDLKGWGYNYYSFESSGNAASTMMACPDNSKKSQFVHAQGYLLDYNGRMPIVIYVPEGFTVKYKIYQSDAEWYEGMEVKQK